MVSSSLCTTNSHFKQNTPFFTFKVIHARSGVPHEIMGLMQGKAIGNTIIIMDSFALPVQGTETRVNAQNEANEYMVEYIQESEKVRFRYSYHVSPQRYNTNFFSGWPIRERHRMVSFSSRLWMLAIWHRRKHSVDKPKISRPIRCCRCALKFFGKTSYI